MDIYYLPISAVFDKTGVFQQRQAMALIDPMMGEMAIFQQLKGSPRGLPSKTFPFYNPATSAGNQDSNPAAARPPEESMIRHSFPMVVTLATCLLVPAISFANGTNRIAPSPIDVLYLITQTTPETYNIETYNVDPGYGSATLYGTLSVYSPWNTVFVPGADDHHVYLFSPYGTEGTVLQVYATDSNGAPQDPPIQTVKFKKAISPFLIDPDGKLAYATQMLYDTSRVPTFGIWAFALDPKTGIVTVPPTLSAITSPPLDGICNPDNPFANPSFSLVGFNLSGTQLIDAWDCEGHDDSVGYYYTQTVNQQTGALGSPVATVGTESSMDEYSSVMFTPTAILSFQNQGYEGSVNELYVYWVNATLDFSCTYTMLNACSYSGGITADRTGKFIFFYTYTGGTEVTRINVNKKTIEPVGTPLANFIEAFSLDDRLIYNYRILSWNGQYIIPVYVFDPGTGLVTNNGTAITMPSEYSSLIPALLY